MVVYSDWWLLSPPATIWTTNSGLKKELSWLVKNWKWLDLCGDKVIAFLSRQSLIQPCLFITHVLFPSEPPHFYQSCWLKADALQKTCPCSCPWNNACVPWPLRRGVRGLGAKWWLHADIFPVLTLETPGLSSTRHNTHSADVLSLSSLCRGPMLLLCFIPVQRGLHDNPSASTI